MSSLKKEIKQSNKQVFLADLHVVLSTPWSTHLSQDCFTGPRFIYCKYQNRKRPCNLKGGYFWTRPGIDREMKKYIAHEHIAFVNGRKAFWWYQRVVAFWPRANLLTCRVMDIFCCIRGCFSCISSSPLTDSWLRGTMGIVMSKQLPARLELIKLQFSLENLFIDTNDG